MKRSILLLFSLVLAGCGTGTQSGGLSSSSASQQVAGCKIGGCSAQLCVEMNDNGVSDCMFKEEYACYKTAVCERQANGACGWTPSPELAQCIADARAKPPASDVQ